MTEEMKEMKEKMREYVNSLSVDNEKKKIRSKCKTITKEYTIWCEADLDDRDAYPDGHIDSERDEVSNKKEMIKIKQKCGWKFINGYWYCPACNSEYEIQDVMRFGFSYEEAKNLIACQPE